MLERGYAMARAAAPAGAAEDSRLSLSVTPALDAHDRSTVMACCSGDTAANAPGILRMASPTAPPRACLRERAVTR